MPRSHRLPSLILCVVLASSCGSEGRENSRPAAGEPPVHPGFALTSRDLAELISASRLPEALKSGLLSKQREFLELLLPVLKEDGFLVLVDKKHPLPPSYEPKDLADLKGLGITVNRPGLKLRERAAGALAAMAKAAKNDGVTLAVSSAYRSYDYQKTVYERNVRELGQTAADRESASPGRSQHQLGTAVDFGSIDDSFAATPASKWLARHAYEYGFSLSFPLAYEEITGYRHESWHYRYLGREAALLEKRFFGGIQQHLLEFLAAQGESFARTRRN